MSQIERDPWFELKALTTARIALGRSGGSLRTATQLELRLAHARARDAIRMPFDLATLQARLSTCGIEHECLSTRASSRDEYLMDPGKGRVLSDAARCSLSEQRSAWERHELVIVISDGLSALAAERQSLPTLEALLPLLAAERVTTFPILLVPYARVKLADEIGQLLGAQLSLILLGERPGLSSPDSLGAYITFGPNERRSDADRNCISNIRPDGIPPAIAAGQIAGTLLAARKHQLTGVGLKIEHPTGPQRLG